jgi:excisionase family DNA binding protein
MNICQFLTFIEIGIILIADGIIRQMKGVPTMAIKESVIMAGPLLSLREVAQMLGISERTVYRLMEDGELHPFKMGKSWKFEQPDIEAYLDRLRKTTTKKPRSEASA